MMLNGSIPRTVACMLLATVLRNVIRAPSGTSPIHLDTSLGASLVLLTGAVGNRDATFSRRSGVLLQMIPLSPGD